MSPEQEALERRAVACEGWRWMAGMAVTDPTGVSGRIEAVSCTGKSAWVVNERGRAWICAPDMLAFNPDLSDPATLGCLLALVRDAWDDPEIHVATLWSMKRRVGWRVWFGHDLTLFFDGGTEAEALVAALEAAPVRTGGER